jgi:hypothetical protein
MNKYEPDKPEAEHEKDNEVPRIQAGGAGHTNLRGMRNK